MDALEATFLRLSTGRMFWKAVLSRIAWHIERAFVRFRRSAPSGTGVIEPYVGYSTSEGLVARGRVLVMLRDRHPRPDQSRLINFWHLVMRFMTREVAGATVRACNMESSAVSDEEGYFTLLLPVFPDGCGWTEIAAQLAERSESRVNLPVSVTDPAATFGIISDIDDTIMRTGAYSLALNLWTTFTGNSMTREVFPDAVELIERLHAGRNPVFFVSSSPWNLHDFLVQVFHRADLVRGPLFLRDLGIGKDQFLTRSHGSHKGSAIDTIFSANPRLPFVLIGDTGQHDAEVYLQAAKRHQGRVRRIILRAPGPGADETDKRFATEAAALGIDVSIGRDFSSLIRIHPGETAQPDRIAT
jgi:phosphatidate phosphatase APP1